MSASATLMQEWFGAFRDSVSSQLDEIHPSAARACRGYLADMQNAIERGDNAKLTRLLRIVQNKIADELEWEEDKERAADDPSYIPRCMRARLSA
jgi:hypothetical protein